MQGSPAPSAGPDDALLAIRDVTPAVARDNGRWSASLTMDGVFVGVVMGKQGQTLDRIQRDSGATVLVLAPDTRRTREPVTVGIEALTGESVDAAKAMVCKTVDEAVEGRALDYSHFISLPLSHPQLVRHFTTFRDSILAQTDSARGGTGTGPQAPAAQPQTLRHPGRHCGASGPVPGSQPEGEVAGAPAGENGAGEGVDGSSPRCEGAAAPWGNPAPPRRVHAGVDPSLFLNPLQLHLTVQMLKLWNQARLDKARTALKEALPAVLEALEGKPLGVCVSNLHLMKGSPRSAHVLYAGVEEEDGTQTRLLRACEVLRKAMRDAGLVTDVDTGQPLKLHLTLMNTSHRKRRGKKGFKRIPFDATAIMKQFDSLKWGTYNISEAHVSQRFVFDNSGYYHCCECILLQP